MNLRALEVGATVDIVAPASRCTNDELKRGLAAIRALGLKPRVPRDLFARSVLFANDDHVRLAHLQGALRAPDSDLIWCVRGGYGALRLLPELAKMKRPARPKLFLGYSDLTTVHAFLNQRWGWSSLHGPLVDRFGGGAMSKRERAQLLALLFGRARAVEFAKLKPLNGAARGERTVRGPVVGGNMAVLQSSLGTPFQLRTQGKILFLEDTGERPHRVDRMLTQFAQAGLFRHARALVLGHFLLHDPKDRARLWRDVFARFAAEASLPVVAGLPVGHSAKLQLTLPLGTPARLELGATPSLSVSSGIAPTA